MRTYSTAKMGVAALAVALAAAGCGSTRSSDPAAAGKTAASSDSSSAASAKFGSMASPCGSGNASGATDQGVADKTITIGYGDDRGYTPAPGLDQQVGDAVTAMIKWCNDQGGINGRQLVGKQYDAAINNTVPIMKQACKEDFMLVGNGFANDFAGDPVRVACKLPQVPAFTVGPNATMGALKVEPLPYPVDKYNAAGLKAEVATIPAIKQGITIIRSDAPATEVAEYRTQAALGSLQTATKDCGIVLHEAGDASYAPLAQKLKACGVKSFYTAYTPSPQVFGFLQAVQQAGVKMPMIAESQWYGADAAQWNSKTHAADGMVVPITTEPLENASVVPAVADYEKIVKATGGKTSMTGEEAASAFLLWAAAAKDCGSKLTRDCVMTKLSAVHDWTAGGLQAPSDPGANLPTDCTILMQLQGGTWKQAYPAKQGQFSCDTSNVIPMDPKISGIKLDANRQFASFLKQ